MSQMHLVIMPGDHMSTDFPLADDEEFPSEIQKSARQPIPAQPLPREEVEDQEEKARFISNILELQNTLEDLSQRVDSVKEESLKLRSENHVLGQYMQNLMASSTVFHPANTRHVSNKNDENDDFEW